MFETDSFGARWDPRRNRHTAKLHRRTPWIEKIGGGRERSSTMDAALRAIKPEPINDEQTMQLD